MSIPVPPLKEMDLPVREKPFWKMIGPGAVLAGLSIGSGELIMWPWITAKVGASLIWAAAIGIFIQLWVNIEIGRWAVATGESPLTGFARVWRLFVYLFVFMLVVGILLPGWARETGVALRDLIFGPGHSSPQWLWTGGVFLAIAGILFGPKRIYAAVERCIMFLVATIVIGLMIVVVKVGTFEHFVDMGKGLLNVGHFVQFDDELTFGRFFGAVVFAGAGGLGNLFYAYYLREKHVGMGARMPSLMSALRSHETKEMDTGYVFPETEENRRRFRDWFLFVKVDQTLFFWLLNSFTMFLFIFGSLAVLHPMGLVPDTGSLVWDLATILEGTMGKFGRYLFLIVGMAALFSTQLAGVDGGGRIFSELLHNNFKFGRRFTLEQWYLYLVIATMVIGTGSVWFFEKHDVAGLDFLFISALIAGFAMAVYVPTILYMNLKYLPKSARPGPVNIFFMVIGSMMYIGFAGYTIWNKVAQYIG